MVVFSTEIEKESDHFYETDKNFSMKIHYANYPDDDANLFWINMESEKNAKTWNESMYLTVSFDVPFGFQLFDLNVTRIVVTPQGIIEPEELRLYNKKWNIAPLNGKFGTRSSKISILVKGNNLYIQWNKFRFDDEYYGQHEFSFQVRLGERGEIDFVYRKVPYNMTDLQKACPECLEDKFGVVYTHHEVFEVPRRYIESYKLGFSMDFEKYEVKDGTVVRFFPADRCMGQKNSDDCTKTKFQINAKKTGQCSWCPAIRKCSSKRDSLRHAWKENKCDDNDKNVPSTSHSDSKNISDNGSFKSMFLVVFWIITPLIVMVTLCVVSKDQIVRIFQTTPAQWFRDFIECFDERNQPDDNNQAEDENNDQELQEL
ncbi:plexin domain-containing protein 2-like [Cloeon dipterum]|uniref:plexin domain-containing protein 2-like n=1 Tax=Cloeon dipterum TaxID=197152 RepID=UPI00322092F8